MTFSSSPPRGHISVSQSVPSGAKARPEGLRCPVDHVIARTPPASYIGLPGAALPSSVRRRILPSDCSESCAGEKRWRSPELRNRYLPSGEKAMRAPTWQPGPFEPDRQHTDTFWSAACAGLGVTNVPLEIGRA